MNYKRITLLCGHYGSGKTNVAVNLALDLKKQNEKTAIADLDIVNPYFRTKDSRDVLEKAGVQLIASEYAGSNVDIPALPQQMYMITDDKSKSFIIDVGGDDRGALALGRLAPEIIAENDYEMLMVINCCRPLTQDAESTVDVMHEIESAGGITFTGIINNTNLGEETSADVILDSVPYAEEVARKTGLPLVMTCADKRLETALTGKIENLFLLELQEKIT